MSRVVDQSAAQDLRRAERFANGWADETLATARFGRSARVRELYRAYVAAARSAGRPYMTLPSFRGFLTGTRGISITTKDVALGVRPPAWLLRVLK